MQMGKPDVSRDANSVPGFPQDAFMEGPMMAMDEMVDKPENYGLRPGWSGFMAGMMTFVRVLPPDKYDHIVDLQQKKKVKNRCRICLEWSTNMNSSTKPVKFTPMIDDARFSFLRSVVRLFVGVSAFLLLVMTPAVAQTPAPDQKTISLEELQQMALQNNPTFAQATANIRAAEG